MSPAAASRMRARRREFLWELDDEPDWTEGSSFEQDPAGQPAPELAEPETTETALRNAQQSIGNRAVSRLLARDPNPALKKGPPEKIPLKTAAEVNTIFSTNQYVKDLVGEKMKKQNLTAVMTIDDEQTFQDAWVEYAKRSINPNTGAYFKDDQEALDFLKIKGVRAFQDDRKDTRRVHIRQEKSDLGTQLHEGLHFFSDDRWKRQSGYNANEGVTEFFTRKMGPEVKVERDDSFYLQQFTSATHLVTAAGEDIVKRAYFDGDVSALRQKIDSRGAGTWDKWLDYMDRSDYKAANKLVAS
jgi:hypothetical protein